MFLRQIPAVTAEPDRVVEGGSFAEVADGQRERSVDPAALADARQRGDETEFRVAEAGEVFPHEGEKLEGLPPAAHHRVADRTAVERVHAGEPRGVDEKHSLFRHPHADEPVIRELPDPLRGEPADLLQHPVGVVFVDVAGKRRFIDPFDLELQRCRGGAMVGVAADPEGYACRGGEVGIAGRVDELRRGEIEKPALVVKRDRGDFPPPGGTADETGEEQKIDAGVETLAVEKFTHPPAVERNSGGEVRVAVPAEGGVALSFRLRKEREAFGGRGFGEAAEEPADHEAGTVGEASAEPVADSAAGSGASEFAGRLDQQGFRPRFGGGDGGGDTGGAAAGNDHVIEIVPIAGGVRLFFRSHGACSFLAVSGFQHVPACPSGG